MISRTATKVGTEVIVERASFSLFHEQLEINKVEVTHKLRFRFLTVVALALFCDYLLLTLCVPILPSLFGDNYSAIQIGIVFASKPICQFLANPYMGSIVDLYGPKYPLLIGVIVLSLSTFLFAFGLSFKDDLPTAYAIVFVARSVQGFASASTMSAGMTLSALTHHESTRGTAMGISMLGVALGTLTGPPMGGIMGNFLPLWSPYVVVGCLLLVNAAAQLYVLHMPSSTIPVYIKEAGEQPHRPSRMSHVTKLSERTTDMNTVHYKPERPTELQSERNTERHTERHTSTEHHTEVRLSNTIEEVVSIVTLLKDRKILVVVAVAITGNACIGMIEPLVPLYLHNTFNSSLLQQGLIFATATASYLIFTPIAGTLSDSYPKWGCLCVGLAALAFGLGFLYASTGIFRVCVSLFFVGAGMSFIDTPSLPLLSEIIEHDDMFSSAAGQVYALSDMSLCVGFAAGPILGPLLQEAFGGGTDGFHVAALAMGLLCCCILPLPYLVLRNFRSADAASADVKTPTPNSPSKSTSGADSRQISISPIHSPGGAIRHPIHAHQNAAP